nr:DNA methylase [Escherichia coli]
MYCTVKEIIREVLDTDVPDSECVFAVVLTRGDVRHIAQDWSLTDDSWKPSCSGWTMPLNMVRMSALFTALFVN